MIEDATSPRHFEWARHRSRGELLDLVLEVEDRMRRLVRAVLRDAASDEAPAAWEPLIGDSLHAQIALTPARPAHADLLDRATLKQLFMIVLHRWDLFSDLFGERSRFHDEADRFLGWRNQLAHGKQPSELEKIEVASTISKLGRHLAFTADPARLSESSVVGAAVLWADDRPELTLRERQILRLLGIDVLPVLSNDEAAAAAAGRAFDLVITDIDRGGGERGDLLPARLVAVGCAAPVLFYVGEVARELGTPSGAHSVHDDPATLLRDALVVLGRRAEPAWPHRPPE